MGKWTNAKIEDELLIICEKIDKFPTHNYLHSIGKGGLVNAIAKSGKRLSDYRELCGFGPNHNSILNSYPPLNYRQIQVIEGSLLGDGNLSFDKKRNSKFSKKQRKDRGEYLHWHFSELKPYSSHIRVIKEPKMKRNDGGIYHDKNEIVEALNFYTCLHEVFSKLRETWYKDGKKKIPKNLILTPLILAIWFCDDGSSDLKNRDCRIATHGFDFECVKLLVSKLKVLEINCTINSQNNKYYIVISKKNCKQFIEIIKPFIHFDCFAYKVDLSKYKEYVPKKNTPDNIIEMKKLRETEKLTYAEIGRKYNMSATYAMNLIKGNK